MAPNWKLELYKRDNWCCQKCGSGVDLGIHHIFPQSKYPELKRNRANLITLCNTCHQYYHNVYCKRSIEKCNPLTFLEWLGEEFVDNNFSHEPRYIVKIDKRYKEHFNRIFKEKVEET